MICDKMGLGMKFIIIGSYHDTGLGTLTSFIMYIEEVFTQYKCVSFLRSKYTITFLFWVSVRTNHFRKKT